MSEQPPVEIESSEQDGTSSSKPSKKVLVVAFLTIFLDLLGFGIIIPIQPFLRKILWSICHGCNAAWGFLFCDAVLLFSILGRAV